MFLFVYMQKAKWYHFKNLVTKHPCWCLLAWGCALLFQALPFLNASALNPFGASPAPTPSYKTRDKVSSSVHTIPVTTPGGVGFILATSVQSLLFHSHPLEKSQIIWWAMVITVVKMFCYYLHRTRHETLITEWECPIISYITLSLPSTPHWPPTGSSWIYLYKTPHPRAKEN